MTDTNMEVEKYTEIIFNQQGIVIGYEKDQKNGLLDWDGVDALDRTDINAKQFLEELGVIIVKKDLCPLVKSNYDRHPIIPHNWGDTK